MTNYLRTKEEDGFVVGWLFGCLVVWWFGGFEVSMIRCFVYKRQHPTPNT